MAACAVRSHAPRVYVLALVASDTLLGNLLLHVSRAVAVLAIEARMRLFQCESGLLAVIEPGRLPAGSGMTIAALGPAPTAMHVIRRVTGGALGRSAVVAISEMTLHAFDALVLVTQGKDGLVVIEGHVLPRLRVMTGCTIAPQPARVRLLGLVTGNAFGPCFAEAFPRRVATLAGKIDVRPVKREVGGIVIELFPAQLHDVRRPALVLRVARPALGRLDSLQTAMKATVGADVSADILMAVQTQLPLVAAIGTVMAIRALLL
jgi:hypothetical protein